MRSAVCLLLFNIVFKRAQVTPGNLFEHTEPNVFLVDLNDSDHDKNIYIAAVRNLQIQMPEHSEANMFYNAKC